MQTGRNGAGQRLAMEFARRHKAGLLESGAREAHGLHEEQHPTKLFLRAERRADGRRTYRMIKGKPRPTSRGSNLYERVSAPGPDRAT